MKHIHRLLQALLLSALLGAPAAGAGMEGAFLTWSELPPLPPPPGGVMQHGLAGVFAGVSEGALLVAGGANFPEGPPWEGGKKRWWADVYVLERGPGGKTAWITDPDFTLPRPAAYGVSITTKEGVLCIGGCDATRCFREVFLLRWDRAARRIRVEPRPPLPVPLAFAGGALAGGAVYVAGGRESMSEPRAGRYFFRLDPGRGGWKDAAWEILPPWPGPPRVLPVCAGQEGGEGACFYLFSGRDIAPGRPTRVLADGFAFDPRVGRWKKCAPPSPEGGAPRSVMAGAALPSGAHHVLVFGGDEGTLLLRLEDLARRIAAAAGDPAAKRLLEMERRRLLEHHPGFSRAVLAYHTVTDTWTRAGILPAPAPVTTPAVKWEGAVILPSGEIRPGVRTPSVRRGAPERKAAFGVLDFTVLGAYLLSLAAMGVYFSRREKSTEDFFKASGRIPWWAAGLSIFGTQLSAITFMAVPAKTFATDWRYFSASMAIVLVAPVIVFLFLPFFRRLNVTTAYEYLERRFNLAARLLGSLLFMALHLGRIGIVLFLPSMALSVVTGMPVTLCILLMGGISTAYTVLGGIEAVIWTDVLQVMVLVLGALLSFAVILLDAGEGLPALFHEALAAGKLRAFDFAFDLSTPTFWVVLLGGLAANLVSYGSDQSVIQRYLTTKDERAAARSIWTNAALSIPATLLFYGIGTALFLYYTRHPGDLDPTLENGDALFPWFIVTRLPAGAAGLVIAGVFAASMSSLDSSMNSIAAAVTTDFFRRARPAVREGACLAVARLSTVFVGAAGTALALLLANLGVRSLWDQLNLFIGLFTGGLAGLFLLGILTRRATGAGGVTGLVASGAVQYLVAAHTTFHVWMYPLTGLVACVVIGYGASLLLPGKPCPPGLTAYDPAKP